MSKNNNIKPFLKWVGGKTKLLAEIEKNFPKNLRNKKFTYVEPFLGGGAVFFHLVQNFNIEKAHLNDLNEKLINTYIDVRDNHLELIEKLKKLESDYNGSPEKKIFFWTKEKSLIQQRSLYKNQHYLFF